MDENEDPKTRNEKRMEKERKWMEAQVVGLKAWVNSFLRQRKSSIEDLETDFRDGVRLSDFLELASKKSMSGIDLLPKGKIQCIQNLSICLQFMSSLGIRLLGINAGTIYDGKTKLILGMLWSVCRSPAITNIHKEDGDSSQKGKQSFESQLLTWCQERIAPYGLTAVDFKNSFSNGMVFGALVHSIDSSAIDMSTLNPSVPTQNLNTAFDGAFDKLNIPKLLNADDMVQGSVDERSIVLYATLLFHSASAAESAAAEANTEKSIEKEMEEQLNVEKDIETSKAAMEETLRQIEREIRAADGINAENERLKKLIEYYQNRGKLSDSTIAALESQASILDQLSCDNDKRLLQSTTTGALVGGEGGKLVSTQDVLSDNASWYLAPVEGGSGEVTILHSKSKTFLTQKESGHDAQLTEGVGEGSKWKVVENDNGSLVQNTFTGDYLQLGEDGKVSFAQEAGDGAVFNVQRKSEFLQKKERLRESAVIAASLVEDGGNKMLRNAGSKKFVTSGDGSSPALSAVLGDSSKWGVVMGENGAAHLRSKENGQYLTQDASGALAFSAEKSPASSWLFVRSANRKELHLVNQKTGDYIAQDGDSLKTVSEQDAKKGAAGTGWNIQTEQVKLAGAIADALAAHGGVGFLQNGWTQGYANNIPALRSEIEKDSEWSMTATPEGSLCIQSNQTGEYLTQGPDGEIIMSDEKVDGSHWSAALGPDRDLLLSNRVTGDYLSKSADDVGLAISSERSEQGGGWVVRSEDGNFSTSSQEFRDAAMGTALANALAASGGSALFQHGSTKGYMNNNLGLSDGLGEGTQWEVVGHHDGSWSLRSKADGNCLSLDDGGNLIMSDDIDSVVSQWKVSRGKNGDLLIQNKGTGDYLERGDDGKLGVNPVANEGKGGWVVKTDNASFSSEAGAEGGFCEDGFTLRELEERRRNLKSDIASAKAKVAEDALRRDINDQDMQRMKDYVDLTNLKANEAEKTVDEMEKRIHELKGLFDAEQSEKSKAEEARESAEKELKDKEQLLREIQEKREALKRQLDLSKAAAQREIALRRERDLAIRKLESEQARLKKEIVITGKTLAGLDSLKRNLDEHLEELCAREGESGSLDTAALSKELEGLSIEEQMGLLNGKIQKESKVLLDIMKIEETKKDFEPEVLKTGDLCIKDKDNWNSRFCRLAGRQFKYFAQKDDDKAEGTVDLSLRCEAIRQKAQKEGKTKVWPLKVTVNTVDESGKKIESKLFLRASSKAERHSWFAAFSCITTRVNYLADVEKEGGRPDTRIIDFVSTGEGAPIHELSVDYRPISESGCNALRKGILYHDNIRTLSLQNAQIKDEGLAHLVTALDKVTDLRILRLSGNMITSEGAAKLFAALCMQNTALREIDVSNNKIDAAGVAELLKLITANTQLSSVNLSSNLLGDAGAASVAAALSKSQVPVSSLDLNHNKIGDEGAASIAELISNSTKISSVNLVGNQIGDEGAAKLADAIAAQSAIEYVDLSNNNLGVKGVVIFRKCLEQNKSLKSLNLSGNEKLQGTEELAVLLGVADFSLSNLCLVRESTGPVKIMDVVSDEE